MNRLKKLLGVGLVASALALIPVLPVLAVTPLFGTLSAPTSDGGVAPYIIENTASGSGGGNRTCADVGLAFFGDAGYYEFSSERVNYNGSFDSAFPAGLVVNTDGTYVSFSSTFSIGAVIVKGSNDANVYVYEPQVNSDSGLASPPTGTQQNPAGLSNITFCWNPDEPVIEGQWCSPGYWRQSHHLGSWEATNISPDELYSAYFGPPTLSRQGMRQNAETNPTLWQVLQSPQWYGGEAFNNVGDLLSEAHPDVNFTGERVEDSCPL
jgi:hypothetical protein